MNSKKTIQKPMKKLMMKRFAYNAKSNSPIINTQNNRNDCQNSSQKNSPNYRYTYKGRDSLNSTASNNNLNTSKKNNNILIVKKEKKKMRICILLKL